MSIDKKIVNRLKIINFLFFIYVLKKYVKIIVIKMSLPTYISNKWKEIAIYDNRQ